MARVPYKSSKETPIRRVADKNETEQPIFPGQEKDHDPSRRSTKLKTALMTAIATVFTGGYALWEPRRVEVTQVRLNLPKLPIAFDGLRLIQFSDAHIGFHTGVKQIEKLADLIQEQQPDLICFTGDIVERNAEPMRECIPALSSMQAKLGKFAIFGNHDYRGKQQEEVEKMFEQAGFTLLRNAHVVIQHHEDRIAIVGLDDALTGKPNLATAVEGLDEDIWKMLLMHEPDYADRAASNGFGLQLSGHSHGGQVRFPWIGALSAPRGARKFVKGLYYVGWTKMPVYVNRGFGMTHLPIRFLCRPEVTVFRLQSHQT